MTMLRAHSFTYNSVDYFGDSYNVVVDEVGLVVPDIPRLRLDVQMLGGANGAVTQGSTYDPLKLVIPCVCVSTASSLETTLSSITTAILAADGAEAKLVLWWLPVTANTYYVRRSAEVVFDRGLDGALFTLEFLVPNPVATGTAVPTP